MANTILTVQCTIDRDDAPLEKLQGLVVELEELKGMGFHIHDFKTEAYSSGQRDPYDTYPYTMTVTLKKTPKPTSASKNNMGDWR